MFERSVRIRVSLQGWETLRGDTCEQALPGYSTRSGALGETAPSSGGWRVVQLIMYNIKVVWDLFCL